MNDKMTDMEPMFFDGNGLCKYPPWLEGKTILEVKAMTPHEVYIRRRDWMRKQRGKK